MVKKAQGSHGQQDGTGGQLLLVGQIELIHADLFRPQPLGGLAEVACEQGDLQQVGLLRARGQVPHLHVLDHALTKGCHGQSSLVRWNLLLSSPSMLSQLELC